MWSPRIPALIALLVIEGAPAVQAQTAPSDEVYERVARHVSPKSVLRVEHLEEATELPGTALTRDGFLTPGQRWSYSIDSAGTPVVPWAEVTRVELRASAWEKGVKWGGILGVVSAVSVAVFAAGVSEDEHQWWHDNGSEVVGATIASGLACAAAGAIVAAPFRHWHTLYKAP